MLTLAGWRRGDSGVARCPAAIEAAPAAALDTYVTTLAADVATNSAGAKAANLARATRAHLPVLRGVVLTEQLCEAIATAGAAANLDVATPAAEALHHAWRLAGSGMHTLIVRSSSRAEDGATSSLAGQFRSILNVNSWSDFVAAVDDVVASATTVTLAEASAQRAPMAVLIQPQLDATFGGVMFGIDPVSGREDRLVIAAVNGGPDVLVSGAADGVTHVVTPRGRLVAVSGAPGDDGPLLPARVRVRLARLARRVAHVFGGPQDVEWAIDRSGQLWLLQSRPVTAAAMPVGRQRVLGPGPLAETFPLPLSALEEELWLRPVGEALTEALLLVGASSRRRLAALPPVLSVQGRVAIDLALIGASPIRPSLFKILNPIPPARRLRASWRTGRLRVALPALAQEAMTRVDAELASVGVPTTLPHHQLFAVLRGSHRALVALHAYEILIGLLARRAAADDSGAAAGAGRALRLLADGRTAGMTDAEIIASHPDVLALTPPAIPPLPMPPTAILPTPTAAGGDALLRTREDLRLRARWLQELTALVAWELGDRLVASGSLPDREAVRWLTVTELEAVANGATAPPFEERRNAPAIPPLPAAFELAADGRPVAITTSARRAVGAGGGRGAGPVHDGMGLPPAGAVLVVRTLDPSLAAVLPHLGGLVAETGSVLSHLAILAREFGVPTVVGLAGAVDQFPPGTRVLVDGSTGEVTVDGDGA